MDAETTAHLQERNAIVSIKYLMENPNVLDKLIAETRNTLHALIGIKNSRPVNELTPSEIIVAAPEPPALSIISDEPSSHPPVGQKPLYEYDDKGVPHENVVVKSKGDFTRTPNLLNQARREQWRRQALMHIAANGPSSGYKLRQSNPDGPSEPTWRHLLDGHPWFEKEIDGFHLSAAGWAEAKRDDRKFTDPKFKEENV